MLDAIRAEALKLRRHRATWLMVWIYPIVFGLLLLVQFLRDLSHVTGTPAPTAAALWIQQSTLVWQAPLSGGGRFIMAGFAALVFAGEYGWNTWKLIIPARSRWQLICAKWIVSSLFVFLAFAAADLLALCGSLLRPLVGGPGIPSGITFAALANAHATAAAHSIVPILYTISAASLFAVLATSVLASIILSIVLITVEQLLLPTAVLAYSYAPSVTFALVEALPLYHIANLIAWAKGSGVTLPLGPGASIAVSWPVSLTVSLCWIGVICAAALARFTRQDLN
jgi:ABC-type transport system involved in multi-copper enzyme maturation permease subunit